MATISITIPDEFAPRVLKSMSAQFGYQAIIDGEPNPETRAEFCKRQVKIMILNSVKAYEVNIAAEAARAAAIAEVDTIELS